MNVEISDKVIQNSQKIDIGIRKLQSRLTDVIDRYTEKNANPKDVIQMYKDELAALKSDLQNILRQQKDFRRTVQGAEREVNTITNDMEKMMLKHNINVPDVNSQYK